MDYERIIQELDSLPKEVATKNQQTENDLFEAILVLLSTFSYTDGDIDQSEENFAKLATLRSKIKELADNAGLSELTAYFIQRVEFMKGFIDSTLNTRSISKTTREEINEGQTSIEETVVESLGEVSSEITSEILNTLTFMMVAGASRTLIEDALEELIVGTQSKLGVVSSLLNTKVDIMFSSVVRSYAMMIYTALGYDNFRYEGGLIADSRPFCIERNGNNYTAEQIEAWADLPDWRGRMPGTNAQTIFYYLGGYRCRHWLVPIKNETN
jgi:hypothetical protein